MNGRLSNIRSVHRYVWSKVDSCFLRGSVVLPVKRISYFLHFSLLYVVYRNIEQVHSEVNFDPTKNYSQSNCQDEILSFTFMSMLDWALISDFRLIFTLNLAFLSGSSKQGKAFLAPVVSNCVTPSQEVSLLKSLRQISLVGGNSKRVPKGV